jgi:hypothetical protein
VLGRSVEHLGLCAHRRNLRATTHLALTPHHILASRVHLYI